MNIKFDLCMQNLGFSRSVFDHCLYFKDLNSSTPVFLLLYVDDMLIISPSTSAVKHVQNMLSRYEGLRRCSKDFGH